MAKTLLISGANRGLGLEFVRQYADAGWRVYATCRSPENALELNRLAEASTGRISVHPVDVTNSNHIRGMAAVLGATPLDLLINNAGAAGQRDSQIGNIDAAAWSDTLRINTIAPLCMVQAFVESLATAERPTILTLTSRLGSIGLNDSGGNYVYRSSKAGVNAAMRSAAVDLRGRGVIVVLVHPGWVRTDMGGPNAAIAAGQSVAGMRRLVERLTLGDSGKFFNYDGTELAW